MRVALLNYNKRHLPVHLLNSTLTICHPRILRSLGTLVDLLLLLLLWLNSFSLLFVLMTRNIFTLWNLNILISKLILLMIISFNLRATLIIFCRFFALLSIIFRDSHWMITCRLFVHYLLLLVSLYWLLDLLFILQEWAAYYWIRMLILLIGSRVDDPRCSILLRISIRHLL